MALLDGGLLPASFRGVPFAVSSDELGGGRRVALHQYPGKDEPWAEDMGREARRWRFRGFILEGDVVLAGGPIQLQRALLIAALEKEGPGTLTHPTLGIRNVSVQRFSLSQELDASRKSAVDIEFVESGKRAFPSLSSSTSKLLSAANLCKVALAVDAVRLIALGAAAGGRRQELTTTTAVWSSQVVTLGDDATALHRLAALLPGANGRFSAGGNAGLSGERASGIAATSTIGDLVGIASAGRAALRDGATALAASSASADLGYASDTATAAIALVQALADACADPADAIRLLEQLVAFAPTRPEAASTIGRAVSAMLRRAAAAALVGTVGTYQPTSADDAARLITEIGALLDDQATLAADGGDVDSYKALRGARGAIVQDLRARGATLAQIRTFRSARPTPAVVLAQRWYRDADRAPQLVTQSRAPSPLFMPTELQALAA